MATMRAGTSVAPTARGANEYCVDLANEGIQGAIGVIGFLLMVCTTMLFLQCRRSRRISEILAVLDLLETRAMNFPTVAREEARRQALRLHFERETEDKINRLAQGFESPTSSEPPRRSTLPPLHWPSVRIESESFQPTAPPAEEGERRRDRPSWKTEWAKFNEFRRRNKEFKRESMEWLKEDIRGSFAFSHEARRMGRIYNAFQEKSPNRICEARDAVVALAVPFQETYGAHGHVSAKYELDDLYREVLHEELGTGMARRKPTAPPSEL